MQSSKLAMPVKKIIETDSHIVFHSLKFLQNDVFLVLLRLLY